MAQLFGRLSLTAALLLAAGQPLFAQGSSTGVAGLLPNLILGGIRLDSGTTPPHDAHFTPLNQLSVGTDPRSAAARFQVDAAEVVLNFNRLLATQFATFPLGNSSGGFSFTLDETTGLPARATRSFGPSFGERSLTIGKGRFSGGFSYQHTSFDRFEGEALDNGSVQFLLPHNDCCPGQASNLQAGGDGNLLNPGFESDIVRVRLTLKASTDTAAFFANYGLTSRWDLGVAIPVSRVELEATADADIVRLGTAFLPLVHTFQTGSDVSRRTFTDARSASGIGDIVVRSKYNLWQEGATGFAAALDLRLPTGDEAELLGTGAAQGKIYVIASTGNERFAQHFNVGYTVSGRTDPSQFVAVDDLDVQAEVQQALLPTDAPPDEVNYTAGVEFAATDRLTLLGNLVGRTLRNVGRLELQDKTFTYQPQGAPQAQPLQSATFREFEARQGNLTLGLGALGFKYNVGSRLLLTGHLIFPLTESGLRSRLTTTFGLDYAF